MTVDEYYPTFREALRRFRGRSGLSQEALAERAGISARGLSDLERGVNATPRADTLQLLIAALELDQQEAAQLEAAARSHRAAGSGVLAHFSSYVALRCPGSLPVPLTSMVGRDDELATVCDLLRSPTVRLVSLTGPGGVGKTRIGLAAGATLIHDPFDWVIFCDLAPVRDPASVSEAIARALDAPDNPGMLLPERLREYLGQKRVLLLLDNFEHLVAAATVISDLLIVCPTLKALVTTRTVLRLRGEHEVPIRPLAVPDLRFPLPPGDIERSPAVALFAQRARAARPDWQLTGANARVVAEICQRVDGLPLAIELAAARSKFLSPQALLARLSSRLLVLVAGARDLPARQQTLRDTIGWSYELLDAAHQKLFRSLAVFAGGARMDGIAQVCTPPDVDLLAGLSLLVENSVIQQDECIDGDTRFHVLQTIREFGLEQLRETGELAGLQRRHAAYYRELANQAEPHLTGADQARWLRRLDEELEDVRAALRWCLEAGEVELGLDLAGALWRYSCARVTYAEGYHWLDQLLALQAPPGRPVAPRVLARALLGAGVLAFRSGLPDRGRDLTEAAIARFRTLGDERSLAAAVNNLANVALDLGKDPDRAAALYAESLALARSCGYQRGVGVALLNLAYARHSQGDREQADALLAELLAMRATLPDGNLIACALSSKAVQAIDAGKFDQADALYVESQSIYEQLDQPHEVVEVLTARGDLAIRRGQDDRAAELLQDCIAIQQTFPAHLRNAAVLLLMGHVSLRRGDAATAARLYHESLATARLRDRQGAASASLEALAALAGERGQLERSARLFSVADALRQPESMHEYRIMSQPSYAAEIAAVRAALGEERFASLWENGRSLTLDQAIAAAAAEAA